MSRFALPLVLAASLVAAPAFATPTAGQVVVNPNSMTVGRVVAVSADGKVVTIRTSKFDIPVDAVQLREEGRRLVFDRSAFDLNAAFEADKAAEASSMDVGKPVRDPAGKQLGVISAIEADGIVLQMAAGQLVKLPLNAVAKHAQGAYAGITLEQLQASVPPAAAASAQ